MRRHLQLSIRCLTQIAVRYARRQRRCIDIGDLHWWNIATHVLTVESELEVHHKFVVGRTCAKCFGCHSDAWPEARTPKGTAAAIELHLSLEGALQRRIVRVERQVIRLTLAAAPIGETSGGCLDHTEIGVLVIVQGVETTVIGVPEEFECHGTDKRLGVGTRQTSAPVGTDACVKVGGKVKNGAQTLYFIDLICVHIHYLDLAVHISGIDLRTHCLPLMYLTAVELDRLHLVHVHSTGRDCLNLVHHVVTVSCNRLDLIYTLHLRSNKLALVSHFRHDANGLRLNLHVR